MPELLSFFVVLFASVLFSAIFNRFHLPFVISLILAGIVLGPYGLGWFESTPTIDFLGEIGLIFLMFIAGMETKLSGFAKDKNNITLISLFNGLIPLAVGVLIGFAFQFDSTTSLLLGAIFVSSSIAIIVPSLERHGMIHNRLGREIVSATILEDIFSLVMLSIILQTVDPIAHIPLPLFYLLLLVTLVVLRYLIPRIRRLFYFIGNGPERESIFRFEVRMVIAVLFGVVVIFELLGLHPIIAGFFTGLILSESIETETLNQKIHTISYGLFIPIFFIVVGAQTNFLSIVQTPAAIILTVVIVAASFGAKSISGYLAGRIVKFNHKESLLLGLSTTPQLSTTLAVVFSAHALGLFPDELVAAVVTLSLVTTFTGPYFIEKLSSDLERMPVEV